MEYLDPTTHQFTFLWAGGIGATDYALWRHNTTGEFIHTSTSWIKFPDRGYLVLHPGEKEKEAIKLYASWQKLKV